MRCALASLALWKHRRHSDADQEIEKTKATSEARMAFATINQQVDCMCTSCKSELIVTAFREDHVWPHGEHSERDREFYAVCEPFTRTEIGLLDTNDEEHIRENYPRLARLVREEIESRYLNRVDADGRVRGMFCAAATRH